MTQMNVFNFRMGSNSRGRLFEKGVYVITFILNVIPKYMHL